MIEPRIEEVLEKKLVGYHATISFSDFAVGPLWAKFMPQRKNIRHLQTPDVISMSVYSVNQFTEFNPERKFEKWAVAEVLNFSDVPEGMATYVLPQGLYAIFHYKGRNTDQSIFEYIFKSWLPGSAFDLDDRPHFEVLGPLYKNDDPNSEEDIYIPIRRK